MQEQGWICLYRDLLDKAIWQNSTAEQKTILITLLLMANHEPNQWEWKGKKYTVKSGEFITSLEKIVAKCGKGITTQNVRSALKRFEKLQFLTNESTKQNRLIKIENWRFYQGRENQPNKATNKEVTNDQQRPNKEVTTNNNDNNDNNDNNIFNNLSNDKLFVPLIEKWNELPDAISKISTLKKDTQRYKMLSQRINEYGSDKILEAIEKIKQSSFLLGKNNSGWTITFEWFVRPNNFVKVLEGNYIDKKINKGNFAKGKYIEQQDILSEEEKQEKLKNNSNSINDLFNNY
nr:MAG TPA: replisome organizer [Caudoviricetes sp.]